MKIKFLTLFVLALFVASCGGDKAKKESPSNSDIKADTPTQTTKIDPMQDKGIGPVKSLELGTLNEDLANTGKDLFKAKCTACHKMGKRFIGPDLTDVIDRRTPEWIMNMILNPEEMVQKNEAAKQLLMEYSAPMANQSLTEDEARSILEYFRTTK